MNKELIKENLTKAFKNFKEAISKHHDLNSKRADGGWSIGEIGNHIVKSTLCNMGATKKADRPFDQHATSIKELFLNFQMKLPAAPPLKPDSKNYTITELSSALDENLSEVIKMIDKDDLTELCIDIPLPVWGALSKYEWLVLMESHIIRHTHQVNTFHAVTV
jgi:uncharacterized damage-inducible protein DinB